MVSKYKLCRIGASLGAAVGIIAVLWAIYAYFMGIVSFASITINAAWNAFIYSSVTVGIVTSAVFCACVICFAIGYRDECQYEEVLFTIGLFMFVAWFLIIVFIFIDSFQLPEPRWSPVGSGIAVLPSIIALLFILFYYSETFKFCDKFKKQEQN